MRASPRGRRRRAAGSRGEAGCSFTRASNSLSHSSIGRLICGRGARGSSGQMRGRSGRMASGGGSASVGSGSTASSGGSSDISANLTRGLFQNRSASAPVDEEAAAEPVQGGDDGAAEERDQDDVACRPEGGVDERRREVERAKAADPFADS